MKRWRCPSCGAITNDADLLTDKNPFDFTETITGCPQCMAVFSDPAELMCDEPGCKVASSGGWPSGDVYRFTCYAHRKP